ARTRGKIDMEIILDIIRLCPYLVAHLVPSEGALERAHGRGRRGVGAGDSASGSLGQRAKCPAAGGAPGGAASGRAGLANLPDLGACASPPGLANPAVWRAKPGPRKPRKGVSQTPGASRRSIASLRRQEKGKRAHPAPD